VIGADVVQSIEARLVDNITVHLAPVLVGQGLRFFSCPGLAHPVSFGDN
jgi:riboflavin biosynthesis pyrimidine reductase